MEAGISGMIGQTLQKLGLQIEFDEVQPGRQNVYATLKGSNGGPILLLNGHMDTVPAGAGWTRDPFDPIVKGDSLFGRGAADMKGGLTSMILCASSLVRNDPKLDGDLILAAVVDEELTGAGSKKYMEKRGYGDFAIVCEPTGLDLCTAQKGRRMYSIEVSGKAAHSSDPKQGVNAIVKMMKIVQELERYADSLALRSHHLLDNPSLNVGTITGGVGTTTVPPSCAITVDRRILPNEETESVDLEMKEIVERLKSADNEIRASVTRFYDVAALETSEDSRIAKTVRKVYSDCFGHDLNVKGFPAASDAGFLFPRIPTVIFGPGRLSDAHRLDESVSIQEILDAALVYGGAAISLLS